ncbi:MAG: hypothetical protein EB059_08665 [Alphaproteobacteria bacterium]|nr:hypothetical protein [Alphaproteobacteria bacterium]
MKKLILSVLFAFFICTCVHASASPLIDSQANSIHAAINSGNFAQVNAIAAANPGAQGEIAMFLLSQAQAKITSNPALAAKIFATATPFVAQIPDNQTQSAATIIASIVASASSPAFQKSNPGAASDIFTAALNMSSQPNILAVNSGLHAKVLVDANSFVSANPDGAGKLLKDTVSLAQTPGTMPTINTIGAFAPSAQ